MKAYHNREFIKSEEARALRILSEYQYPLKVFTEEQVTDTIVVFGSSRIPGPEDDRARPAAAYREYYQAARELSGRLARWNREVAIPRKKNYLVTTGGGPGIMEAGNRGPSEAGEESIGLNIFIPAEQHENPYIADRFRFEFQYFFMRKFWFLYHARMLIVFPGGFGTMDELFETLTLQQTEIIKEKIPVVLFGKSFWEKAVNFEFLAEAGMIDREHLELFTMVDSVDEAVAFIVPKLEKHLNQSDPAPG